jgi:hypothetical protein
LFTSLTAIGQVYCPAASIGTEGNLLGVGSISLLVIGEKWADSTDKFTCRVFKNATSSFTAAFGLRLAESLKFAPIP